MYLKRKPVQQEIYFPSGIEDFQNTYSIRDDQTTQNIYDEQGTHKTQDMAQENQNILDTQVSQDNQDNQDNKNIRGNRDNHDIQEDQDIDPLEMSAENGNLVDSFSADISNGSIS